ncbi:hypothetical protein LRP50_14390 [Enterovibrio sp. ZSDZ42]|uniref:Phage shock protein B n=1 Tax=Enterovibrio gelatinilyticus TaxID=2899819 RepID=A0ABT5R2E1_9GAMM|nr:hypothetical protein [Enterovibrio sp. ZSDZ42]MDD1794325.1 hypothetical protein [Enterovibrio sp. ZSDZ42]
MEELLIWGIVATAIPAIAYLLHRMFKKPEVKVIRTPTQADEDYFLEVRMDSFEAEIRAKVERARRESEGKS